MPSVPPWVPVLLSAGWSMAGTCCPCCWGQHSSRTTSSWCITVRISCTQSVGTNGTVSTLGDQVPSWLLFPWLCFTTGPFLAFWAVFSPDTATSFLMQAVIYRITILSLFMGFSYGFPAHKCCGLPLALEAPTLSLHQFPPVSTTLTQHHGFTLVITITLW